MTHAVAFDGGIDGFAFAPASSLDGPWLDRWTAAFAGAAPAALAALRGSFGGAIDLHDVPGWLASPRSADALAGAGWIFTALDYFECCATPPADGDALRSHVEQRHLDCWTEQGAALVEWLAVQRRVPEEWLPRAIVERQLAALLRSAAAAVDVRATVELRPPGGRQWLRERSLDHWRSARASLADGRCCPIVALHGEDATVLLAVGPDGDGIRCWDARDPAAITTIDPSSVDGLFHLRYSAALPPLRAYQRAARAFGLGRLAWRAARAWRTLRRGAR